MNTLGNVWDKPLVLGIRRRCINPNCKQLVLRKGGKAGPRPKFCTFKCYRKFYRRKTYLKRQQLDLEYSRNWRANHKEQVKQYNANWQANLREKKNWKYSYLETLKV